MRIRDNVNRGEPGIGNARCIIAGPAQGKPPAGGPQVGSIAQPLFSAAAVIRAGAPLAAFRPPGPARSFASCTRWASFSRQTHATQDSDYVRSAASWSHYRNPIACKHPVGISRSGEAGSIPRFRQGLFYHSSYFAFMAPFSGADAVLLMAPCSLSVVVFLRTAAVKLVGQPHLLSGAAPGCAQTERGFAAHRSARPEALCEERLHLPAPVFTMTM